MNWSTFNEALKLILHARSRANAFDHLERYSTRLGCSGMFVLHLLPGKTLRGYTRTEIFSQHARLPAMLGRIKHEFLSNVLRSLYDATQPSHIADAVSFLKSRSHFRLARLAAASPSRSIIVVPVSTAENGTYCFMFVGQRLSNSYTQVAALNTLAHVTIEHLLSASAPSEPLTENVLTHRETECLRLLVTGKDDAEIAAEIGIAERTVRFHLDRARAKIGARNRVHAVAMAVGSRLLDR